MRKSALRFLPAIAISFFIASTPVAQEYIPNELWLKTRGLESEQQFREMNAFCGTRIKRQLLVMSLGHTHAYLLEIIDGSSFENAALCWRSFPGVYFLERNYITNPLNK